MPPASSTNSSPTSSSSKTIVPLILMFITIQVPLFVWNLAYHHNGSPMKFYNDQLSSEGFLATFCNIQVQYFGLSWFSVTLVGVFTLWNLLLMRFVPGKKVYGPVTNNGNIPEYKDNGLRCYFINMVTFALMTFYLKKHGLSPSVVYDHFPEILSTLLVFSLIFCLFLCFKGLYFPSSTDCGTSNNVVFDYYWGTELYPRIAGIDVKVFTNCRFGLMAWALLICCFAMKSYELHGYQGSALVTLVLQLLYLTKFYWWEAGYYCTIDIMLDRAGYYICYGCLVFVPAFYTSVSLSLVKQSGDSSALYNGIVLAAGVVSLIINYWADYEKQVVRKTNGNCIIWGQKAKVIRAKYRLTNGEEKDSLLLASGFWSLSRHFHYVPEILLSFFWSAPAGFQNFLTFAYVIYLTGLLLHRSYRDEAKCSQKYGPYWETYKKAVPYKIIPFIF